MSHYHSNWSRMMRQDSKRGEIMSRTKIFMNTCGPIFNKHSDRVLIHNKYTFEFDTLKILFCHC